MLITLKDAKKIFGGEIIFEQLTFEINEKDRIGLVGRNGSGKTTIFKLITKMESLDEGQLFIKKDAKIGYLAQIPTFEGSVMEFLQSSFVEIAEVKNRMAKLEKMMLDSDKFEKALRQYGDLQEQFGQLGGYEMDSKIDRVANGLNIGSLLHQTFADLSGGEKTKAGLAKVLLEEPEVLLLDEPTNHLDLHAIEWLEQFVRDYKGACCIISHDRYFLNRVVNKVADLENGEISYYPGNYSNFVKLKEERLLAEFKAFQEQEKKIKKMKEAIRRLRQWANEGNPPNEKFYRKAKSMEKALERMEKIEKPLIDPKKMNLAFSSEQRSGKDVVRLEGVTKAFGERTVLHGVDLHIRYKERLAIVGPNGSGKSTLLKMIMGEEAPTHGQVQSGTQLQIGYLSQHALQEVPQDTKVIDYFREHIRVTEGQAREILARFMFYGYTVFHKISQLSGGERMRLKLAIFMHQDINLLILDEPTNHLDMDSQEVLEEAIEKFEGTVLCVSHDRYFLNQCFPETAYISDGKLVRYIGNYDETKDKMSS